MCRTRSSVEVEAVESDAVRVVGIDPGTSVTGWAVVDGPFHHARALGYGSWRLHGTLSARLCRMSQSLAEILARYEPTVVVVERNFAGHNVQSALRLGEARGAILATLGAYAVEVAEYTPAAVKLAVTGSGRATKTQVQAMVTRLLHLSGQPGVDAADALALALCHLQSKAVTERIRLAQSAWSRVRTRVKRLPS